MIRVIFNKKGGVGKTSIACNLAAVAASKGKKALVIDLDTQLNTSYYLLSEAYEIEETIADFYTQTALYQSKPLAGFVYETPFENLFLIPASEKLNEMEHQLESRYKMFKLREGLDQLSENYDEIYIDTPPAFNFYTKSALLAAHRVLIPFDCDTFSKRSIDVVKEMIFDLCAEHNPEITLEGIIVNQFQPRANLPQQLIADIKEAGYPILSTHLNSSVKMKESHQRAKPLVYFATKHDLTKQFIALHEELNLNDDMTDEDLIEKQTADENADA